MTGRDLIVYIIENNLEDELVFKDGRFIGFLTANEAAIRFNVGVETVRFWVEFGYLDGVKIGDELYIPSNAEVNKERKRNEKQNISNADNHVAYGVYNPRGCRSTFAFDECAATKHTNSRIQNK